MPYIIPSTTPDPWTVRNGSVYAGDVCIAHMDREERGTRPVERDANARLAAAAPKLARVLAELVFSATPTDYQNAVDILNDLGVVRTGEVE